MTNVNQNSYERFIAVAEAYGLTVRETQRGVTARIQTPGHSPTDNGIAITYNGSQTLAYCHNGDIDDVLGELGLTYKDLYDTSNHVEYRYPDARVVFRKIDKKGFTQRGNTKGTALYGSDKIKDTGVIYVVEGEKDVQTIQTVWEANAVTQAQGASTDPSKADWTPLSGRDVIIIADKDEPGYKRAKKVLEHLNSLQRPPATVRVVEAAAGKDISDHIAAGKTAEDLVTVNMPTATSDPLPRIFTASQMRKSKPTEWLAKFRVALAVITVFIGDEGIGKSLFWVWLARFITTGTACPEFGIKAGKPQHVVLLLAENGFVDMDRPRLEAAGVDLDYVHVIATHDDGSGAPAFTAHTRYLIDDLVASGIKPVLFVADPWLDTVPADLNVRDGQQAKRALRPWRELAVQHNAAVLLVAHTNRMSTGNARDKYGATAELRKTARMTLFAQTDDETGLLSIGPEKSNLTPRDIRASLFRIVTHEWPGWEDGVPALDYVGESQHTSQELIETKFEAETGIGDVEDKAEAEKFLLDLMRNQPVKATDVFQKAGKVGISKDQAKRAKKKLGIKSKKVDDSWVWVTKKFEESTEGGITFNPAPLPPCSLAGQEGDVKSHEQEGGKSASEHSDTQPRYVEVSTADQTQEIKAMIIGALSTDMGLTEDVVLGSVPKKAASKEVAKAIFDSLVATGAVAIDSRGRYIKPKEQAA